MCARAAVLCASHGVTARRCVTITVCVTCVCVCVCLRCHAAGGVSRCVTVCHGVVLCQCVGVGAAVQPGRPPTGSWGWGELAEAPGPAGRGLRGGEPGRHGAAAGSGEPAPANHESLSFLGRGFCQRCFLSCQILSTLVPRVPARGPGAGTSAPQCCFLNF